MMIWNGQERQVGEGGRAAAGDEGADLVEVAERLQPVAGERVPERQGDDGAEDLGVHHLVDIGADADQDAGPHLVEEAERGVEERDDRREAEERRDALARDHAVVNLQHEQRPGQGQDVHDAAEDDDAAERTPAIVDRRREFRPSGIIRPFPPPEHE